MRIEGDILPRLGWPCLMEAGADEEGFEEYIKWTHVGQPQRFILPFTHDGVTVRVPVEIVPTGSPRERLILELPEGPLVERARTAIANYAPESAEAYFDGVMRASWAPIEASLAAYGVTVEGLHSWKDRLTPEIADVLMRLFEQRVDHHRIRELLLGALRDHELPRSEKARISRWLCDQFRMERNRHARGRLGEVLKILANSETADTIAELLQDRRYGFDRAMLCWALPASKYPKAASLLASLLDDDTIASVVITVLCKLKATQYADRIEPLLKHKLALVRRAAKSALKRMGRIEIAPPRHLVKKGRPPRGLEEWSTNLDMEELGPVLARVLKAPEVAEVVDVADEMEVNQTRTLRFGDIWIRVFMDDEDSPDLSVFASQDVLERLE